MAIVSGVNIPDNKRVEISLRSIYGIGPHQARDVCDRAGVDGNPRVRDLASAPTRTRAASALPASTRCGPAGVT